MNINPEFMWEFFNKNPVQYNLRKGDIVYLPHARSSCYGINSLAFRGSLLRNSLPINVKQSHDLKEFKLKLKNLGNIHCTCVVCRLNQFNDFIFFLCYVSLMLHLYYVFYILNFL